MGILSQSFSLGPWATGAVIGAAIGSWPVAAQIATDGTVGPKLSLTGPAFEIPAGLGRTAGPNLLHSFRQFDLRAGEQATFTGPASVANVIARVTGGAASRVDGTLRSTIPGADFYFVNPAGVVFGPEAKVDVGGSFAVTTADRLRMADGTSIESRPPENEVLTIAPPSAFGFLPGPESGASASVTFQGSRLAVAPGRDLTVVAGEVKAEARTQLQIPDGRVAVAAVASPGEVSVDGVNLEGFERLGNIRLLEGSTILVGEEGAGQATVRANDLVMESAEAGFFGASGIGIHTTGTSIGAPSEIDLRGRLQADGGRLETTATDQSRGSDLDVRAHDIELSRGSLVSTAEGASRGGDIRVEGVGMLIDANGNVTAEGRDDADAGNLDLEFESIELSNGTVGSGNDGRGRAGSIEIKARSILMGDGDYAEIHSRSEAEDGGPAGSISIQADRMAMGENSYVTTSFSGTSESFDSGGDITLRVRDLEIDGGTVWTQTSYAGRAGSVVVEAEVFTLGGAALVSAIWSDSGLEAEGHTGGDSGDISIRAKQISMYQGSLATTTYGAGKGGNITLGADRLVIDAESDISSGPFGREDVDQQAGSGGDIDIEASEMRLMDGSWITSATDNDGPSGNIRLKVGELTLDSGFVQSGSNALFEGDQGGKGGDIDIAARSMEMIGGEISSAAWGRGDGGRVSIEVENQLVVENGAISSAADGDGRSGAEAGDILISAGGIDLVDFSEVRASTSGASQGGNLTLISRGTLTVRDGIVNASAEGFDAGAGSAGDISIRAPDLRVLGSGQIMSLSEGPGAGGRISLSGETLVLEGSADSLGERASISTLANGFSFDGIPVAGPAGDIQLNFRDIEFGNGFEVDSSSNGSGPAGNILIQATRLRLRGNDIESGIWSQSNSFDEGSPQGRAGNIRIVTEEFRIEQFGSVSAATEGTGPGGSVDIRAGILRTEGLEIAISTSSLDSGPRAGRAGDLSIEGRQIDLGSGTTVSSKSDGPADAGSVKVVGLDGVRVADAAVLVDSAGGNGGSVTVESGGVVSVRTGTIGASAWLLGGQVWIRSAALLINGSTLHAEAEQGNGGVVVIGTGLYLRLGENSVSVKSRNESAQSGTLTVDSALDLTGSLLVLPGDVWSEGVEVLEGCARRNPRSNSLLVRGKGGSPASPVPPWLLSSFRAAKSVP